MSSTKKTKTFYETGMNFMSTLNWLVFTRTTGFSPFSLVLAGLALLAATIYVGALIFAAVIANPVTSLAMMCGAIFAFGEIDAQKTQKNLKRLNTAREKFNNISEKVNSNESYWDNRDSLKRQIETIKTLAEEFKDDKHPEVKKWLETVPAEVEKKYEDLKEKYKDKSAIPRVINTVTSNLLGRTFLGQRIFNTGNDETNAPKNNTA